MNLVLAAFLVIHPVLDAPHEMRMVAVGTGDDEVQWTVDGLEMGASRDREAVRVSMEAGRHEVQAHTAHDGAWEILVRPDPRGHEGAAYVPAWTARHEPPPAESSTVSEWLWAVPLLVVAAAACAVPRLRRRRGGSLDA